MWKKLVSKKISNCQLMIVLVANKTASSLDGCVNDVNNISKLIEKNYDGSRNFDTKLITSEHKKEGLSNLFSRPADIALFYFSGHGTATNLGGYLCTYEVDNYDNGYPMQNILTLINNSPINEVVVILECYQSDSLGHLPTLGAIWNFHITCLQRSLW